MSPPRVIDTSHDTAGETKIFEHRKNKSDDNNEGDDEENEDEEQNQEQFDINYFKEELVKWAIEYKINHDQLKGLLGLWNNCVPLPPLPIDPRTVLKTPRSVERYDDNYWHYGLEKQLLVVLQNLPCECVPAKVSLRFNFDGIPLSKSSSVDCWPILFDIFELKTIAPRVIGIYCGKSKPKNIERFLRNTIDELRECIKNGILLNNGRKIEVSVKMIICDSPARALVKGIYNISNIISHIVNISLLFLILFTRFFRY